MCKILITFNGSRGAIKADGVLKKAGINGQVIATPSEISSECGMSIIVAENKKDMTVIILQNENIEFKIYNY